MGATTSTPASPVEESQPDTLRSNLPAALSTFIGRADAVNQLQADLSRHRLLTVVGAGGAGKTRLAREVASRIAETLPTDPRYRDGVWWVELAPVELGTDVTSAIAAALGVNPSPGRRLVDALAEALRPQRLLLVLDNCEHLLNETAQVVDSVLRSAAGVTILCTSREALSVEGEVAWPLAPLPRPSVTDHLNATDLAAVESVQLFVERARAVTRTFVLTDANAPAVAAICARLDGLPLALELAAAVVPVLGVEALAARLDDALSLLSRGRRTALPRHRTLHAVLDWSYALLSEQERTLLCHLSVFRGSFTLDEMADVCGTAGLDMVAALGRLVEHSLVDVREEDGEVRYRLLETVRQFGSALLRGTPEEDSVRGRHARWVGRLAAHAEPAFYSPGRGQMVDRLRHSVDEIRAALVWATGPTGSPILAADIAGMLGWFWLSGLPWEEGRALLDRTMAAVDAQHVADAERPIAEQVAIGRLCYPMLGLAYFAGDADTMLRIGARELAIWDCVDAGLARTDAQRLSSARGRSLALQLTGFAHAMRGDAQLAIATLNECVAVAERSGDRWLHAVLTMRRALGYLMVGEHHKAQADYQSAIPSLRAMGERWFLSLALEGMAVNALAIGEVSAGLRYARESITVLEQEPDPWFISRSLDTMACILVSSEDNTPVPDSPPLRLATRLLGTAESLRRRCGAAVIGPDVQRQSNLTATLHARLGESVYREQFAAGMQLTLPDVFALMSSDPIISSSPARADLAPREVRRIALQVLGPFVCHREGEASSADPIPTGKVREMLLYFLLHEKATKDEIGLALWPDASAAQVRNAFHVTLHHLRRHLGPEPWIVAERGFYRLDRHPSADVRLEVDLDTMLQAGALLRSAIRRQQTLDAMTIERAGSGLLQGGADLAPGFPGGEWLVASQDRVRAAWVDGVDALARVHIASGRLADGLAACEALVSREPLRESAHRMLMEVLANIGEPGRALAHFDLLTVTLAREVGSRPAAETRALAERLRA